MRGAHCHADRRVSRGEAGDGPTGLHSLISGVGDARCENWGVARVIRFLFEYGHPWPLWESTSERYTMEPIDYGLSAELTAHLRDAYELWESNFSPESGWVTPAAKARWAAA